MNINSLLKEAGLKQKESRILSYLYEKGKSKASVIAAERGIPKSTVLFILYKLERQDLVSKIIKGKTYIFEAKDPEELLKKIDRKIQSLKLKRKKLSPKIPDLRRLKDLKASGKIYFFDEKSSIAELRHSINEKLDNKDMNLLYSKNYKRILANEDFVFFLSDDFGIRFESIKTLKNFILALKDIDERQF